MLICVFMIGLVVGSFLGVVAWRVPQAQSLLTPASHCSHCQQKLAPKDLVPLLSALFLKGRCRYCLQPFGWSSWWLELLSGLFSVLFFYKWGLSWEFIFALLLLWMALTLALCDFFFLIIEPKILYSFTGLLLLFFSQLPGPFFRHGTEMLILLVILGSLTLLLPEQLGTGDIMLLGIWCFFLGLETTFTLILIASFSSLAYLLWQFGHQRFQKEQPLPFVPFLTLGLLCTLSLS